MLRSILLALTALTAMSAATPASAQTRSVYTTLDPDLCQTTDENLDEGWSEQRCPGTAGYALDVSEGDLRQTVAVVVPGGAAFPLDFGSHVSSAFSSVGPQAEWRLVGQQPVALIVRLNAGEDVEDPYRIVSRLAVAHVSQHGACLVGVIEASTDMNERARRMADRAEQMLCLAAP